VVASVVSSDFHFSLPASRLTRKTSLLINLNLLRDQQALIASAHAQRRCSPCVINTTKTTHKFASEIFDISGGGLKSAKQDLTSIIQSRGWGETVSECETDLVATKFKIQLDGR
jgi:hypothetical protein